MSKPTQKKHAKRRARAKAKRRVARRVPTKKTTPAERGLKTIDKTWIAACDKAEREGFSPEIVFCMRKTGLMLTREAIEKGEATPDELDAWREALIKYRKEHPDEQIVDQQGKKVSHG